MPGAVCGKVGVEGNGRGGKLQAAVDHVGLACGGDETSGRFMPACMGRLEHDVEVHGRLDVLEERFGGHQADGCLEGDFSKGYASRETGDCRKLVREERTVGREGHGVRDGQVQRNGRALKSAVEFGASLARRGVPEKAARKGAGIRGGRCACGPFACGDRDGRSLEATRTEVGFEGRGGGKGQGAFGGHDGEGRRQDGGVKRVPVERDGGGGKLEQRLFTALQGGGDIGERGVFARQCDPVSVPCEFGAAAADFTLEGGVELFGSGFKKASGPVGDAAEFGAAEHFGKLDDAVEAVGGTRFAQVADRDGGVVDVCPGFGSRQGIGEVDGAPVNDEVVDVEGKRLDRAFDPGANVFGRRVAEDERAVGGRDLGDAGAAREECKRMKPDRGGGHVAADGAVGAGENGVLDGELQARQAGVDVQFGHFDLQSEMMRERVGQTGGDAFGRDEDVKAGDEHQQEEGERGEGKQE